MPCAISAAVMATPLGATLSTSPMALISVVLSAVPTAPTGATESSGTLLRAYVRPDAMVGASLTAVTVMCAMSVAVE